MIETLESVSETTASVTVQVSRFESTRTRKEYQQSGGKYNLPYILKWRPEKLWQIPRNKPPIHYL